MHPRMRQARSDFALVSSGKVYALRGDKSQFDRLAGQNVTIKGKVDGTTITVDSIAATKS
jgi:hydroxyethylthiazole kinase-like sugar kinase family protein